MSTRGYIGRLNPDGTVTTVFSQSNNYPIANGWLLITHYTDPAKIDALLALDSLCEVGLDIGEPHDWADAPARVFPGGWLSWCQSFARDRGDRRLVTQTIAMADWPALAHQQCAEMVFLWTGAAWWCAVVADRGEQWASFVPKFGPWHTLAVVDGAVVTTPIDPPPFPPAPPTPAPPPPYLRHDAPGMVSITVVPREVTEQLIQADRDTL